MGETSEEDVRRVFELQATLREKEAQLEELKKENNGLKEQLSRQSTSADGPPFF